VAMTTATQAARTAAQLREAAQEVARLAARRGSKDEMGTGEVIVTAALWEWSIPRDAHGGSAGVSMTRHGAMEALSRVLVQAGRPGSGQVLPLTLTGPVRHERHYLRGSPERTAVYDRQAIRWS
jgi:hypothetical protein